MNKNKAKKIFLITIICIITIFSSILIISYTKNYYNEQLYKTLNTYLSKIHKDYPEIEEEIIKDIFNKAQANNKEETENILKKYGVEVQNIEEIIGNHNFIQENLLKILYVYIIGITCIILVFIYYNKKQKKKMQELEKYCKEIIRGEENLELKTQEEGLDSILKNNIYDMTMMLKEKNKDLQESNQKTEKLIADISHQLKTPLTSLNLMNDLLYTDLPEEKKKEFLDNSSKELEKINWLIKTLLNIAKLDSKTIILKKDFHNAKEMLEEMINNFATMCEVYKSNITLTVKEDNQIYCDKKWTSEAISNIIKNSIEHKGKNINIQIEENKIYTQITIIDDGEGISPKDISHIFNRFYKAENSKSESLGLGLAFAKSIIKNQDGEIRVQSKKENNSWTKFTIKLYKQII